MTHSSSPYPNQIFNLIDPTAHIWTKLFFSLRPTPLRQKMQNTDQVLIPLHHDDVFICWQRDSRGLFWLPLCASMTVLKPLPTNQKCMGINQKCMETDQKCMGTNESA
mmetsp:Transcript_9904/g.18719  ORF Transcript_9904/g.18719 Transcript_9904/m.18719 type:complete len:108 (+) Transcript_9904:905-1228(+)